MTMTTYAIRRLVPPGGKFAGRYQWVGTYDAANDAARDAHLAQMKADTGCDHYASPADNRTP